MIFDENKTTKSLNVSQQNIATIKVDKIDPDQIDQFANLIKLFLHHDI